MTTYLAYHKMKEPGHAWGVIAYNPPYATCDELHIYQGRDNSFSSGFTYTPQRARLRIDNLEKKYPKIEWEELVKNAPS